MIQLTDKEAAILLGATLMHWGVPFHFALRRGLTDHQQAIIDEASEKLITLREAQQRSQAQEAQAVNLSDQEIVLLVLVLEDCLAECGDDPTELSLQLKTSERRQIETLLGRIRVSMQS
jgi:hypothetical protein